MVVGERATWSSQVLSINQPTRPRHAATCSPEAFHKVVHHHSQLGVSSSSADLTGRLAQRIQRPRQRIPQAATRNTVQGSLQVSAGEHWQARATHAVCAVQLAGLVARSLWWHGGALAPHEATAQRCKGVWAEVCKRATQDELREHQLIMAHVELSSNAALGRHQALCRHRQGARAEPGRSGQLHLEGSTAGGRCHTAVRVCWCAQGCCVRHNPSCGQPHLRQCSLAS